MTNSIDIEVEDRRGAKHGWSTTIWLKGLNDSEDPLQDTDTVRITFHKGNPELAIRICERLTRTCGPLVLIREHDCVPLLIQHGNKSGSEKSQWLEG